jgi:hypothetical protein
MPLDESQFAISIFDVGHGQCRWPLNDAVPISEFQFCGAPVVTGKCWCALHLAIGHIAPVRLPSLQRRRAA